MYCEFCDSSNIRMMYDATYRCRDCGQYFEVQNEAAPLKAKQSIRRRTGRHDDDDQF